MMQEVYVKYIQGCQGICGGLIGTRRRSAITLVLASQRQPINPSFSYFIQLSPTLYNLSYRKVVKSNALVSHLPPRGNDFDESSEKFFNVLQGQTQTHQVLFLKTFPRVV
jgi:hypothetical protein